MIPNIKMKPQFWIIGRGTFKNFFPTLYIWCRAVVDNQINFQGLLHILSFQKECPWKHLFCQVKHTLSTAMLGNPSFLEPKWNGASPREILAFNTSIVTSGCYGDVVFSRCSLGVTLGLTHLKQDGLGLVDLDVQSDILTLNQLSLSLKGRDFFH